MITDDELILELEEVQIQLSRLLIRQAGLISLLKPTRVCKKTVSRTDDVWYVGQKVCITNLGDRQAVITAIHPGRIDICTDDGVDTLRLPKNLRAL